MKCRCNYEIPACSNDVTNLTSGREYTVQCKNVAGDVPSLVDQARAMLKGGLYAENIDGTCRNLSQIAGLVGDDLSSAVSEANSGLSEAQNLLAKYTAEDQRFHDLQERKNNSSGKDKGTSVADK